MGFNVLIKSLAFVDLQDAIDWYELQSTGLGKRFYKEFENCISRIENSPHHYGFIIKMFVGFYLINFSTRYFIH